MSPVRAYYYDGKTSGRTMVTLTRDQSCLRLVGEGVNLAYPIAAAVISTKVANVRRSIRFPDGSLCEVLNDEGLDRLVQKGERPLHRLLCRWERSIPLALLALVATAATVVGFIRIGVPLITRHVVKAIPPASELRLGKDSLAFLDEYMLEPSKLSKEKQAQVKALFDKMKKRLPGSADYRLAFRGSDKIGANAFALPGGIIIVTDRMVELAGTGPELEGVLAHESGHVRARHALRHVLQSTGSGLLIAAVTGDITSITSLSATLPTALVNAGYSRDFEYEADDAAVSYLVSAGIPPKCYAEILSKLQEEQDKRSHEQKGSKVWTPADLLASHPSTPERVGRVLSRKP